MGHVRKKMVAVAFSSPKVQSVLGLLFLVVGIEVFAKPQDYHFPQLKLKILSGQKHLVARNEAQHALVIFWQSVRDGNPMLAHLPTNLAGRFSKNAWTPSE